MSESVPVFILCRNRVTTLIDLLAYLERAGQDRIYLVDNESTYPPLLEFYERTPHRVVRLGGNAGGAGFWNTGLIDDLGITSRYVVSDPDVVPIADCPPDAIEWFGELLDAYPTRRKVGFGLRIDDLPEHYALHQEVAQWEAQFWKKPVMPRVYDAPVDTTFGLYRADVRDPDVDYCLRTGYPYLLKHVPWYLDSNNLGEEEQYYRATARLDTTCWNTDTLKPWMVDFMDSSLAPPPETAGQRFVVAVGPAVGAVAEAEPTPSPIRVLERPAPGTIDVTVPIAVANKIADGNELRVNRNDAPLPPEFENSPWNREPSTVDETAYTPWGEPGWEAWNDMSAEREFCDWVGSLVMMFNPRLVVETGVGQGFTTRRIISMLQPNQDYVGFESANYWRGLMAKLEWFQCPNTLLATEPTPSVELLAQTDLLVLDSDYAARANELDLWLQFGKPGSMLVMHDAGNGHTAASIQGQLHDVMSKLELEGAFLNNPRGGCFAIKPSGRLTDRTLGIR